MLAIGHEYPVHRNIVCNKSSRVLQFIESHNGRANLVLAETDFDAKTFARLHKYIYTSDYGVAVKLPDEPSHSGDKTDGAADGHAMTQSQDLQDRRGVLSIMKDWLLGGRQGAITQKSAQMEIETEANTPTTLRCGRQERFEWTEPEESSALSTTDVMIIHILMYEAGGVYGVPGLQSAALAKLSNAAQGPLDVRGFVNVVLASYTLPKGTAEPLRRAVVKIARDHSEDLLLADVPLATTTSITAFSEFQTDLLSATAKDLHSHNQGRREAYASRRECQQRLTKSQSLAIALGKTVSERDQELGTLKREVGEKNRESARLRDERDTARNEHTELLLLVGNLSTWCYDCRWAPTQPDNGQEFFAVEKDAEGKQVIICLACRNRKRQIRRFLSDCRR
ncbi:hypothetical protein LTR15_000067 [Elasticomyces elasticus]|nr:hypothetical protein LTR15_000067 [Elasticomyces elasticus]